MFQKNDKAGPEADFGFQTGSVKDLEEALLSIDEGTVPESILKLLDQLDTVEGTGRIGSVPMAADRRRALNCTRRRLFLVKAVRVGILTILVMAALVLFSMAAFPNFFSILVEGDTYSVVPSGQMKLLDEPTAQYSSLDQALIENGFPALAPAWIPERFQIAWVHFDDYGETATCSAWYGSDKIESGIFIRVVGSREGVQATEKFESGNQGGAMWKHDGVSYYISVNADDRIRATWTYSGYLGEVVGSITEKELKQILESIQYIREE